MATGFKRREVNLQRVAAAEDIAATAPIVGDPRAVVAYPTANEHTEKKVGAIQVSPSEEIVVGKICDVPVERVRSNPFNPRMVYTSTAVDNMATSILKSGQNTCATGFSDDGIHVTLIEGETRLRGTRAAGLPTLRIEIKQRPASDQELYEQAREANVERNEQTVLDDAIRWKDLLAKKIYPSQVALAKALNLGEDHVSRTLSLATLPGRIITTVADHPALLNQRMLNALREFYEVKGEEETIELIFEAVRKELGYRDIVDKRKAAEKGPIKRPRALKDTVSFGGAKGEIKIFEEDGRLQLTLNGLNSDEARAFTEKLKLILAS